AVGAVFSSMAFHSPLRAERGRLKAAPVRPPPLCNSRRASATCRRFKSITVTHGNLRDARRLRPARDVALRARPGYKLIGSRPEKTSTAGWAERDRDGDDANQSRLGLSGC